MGWLIGAIVFTLISTAWIIYVMADVFRGKYSNWSAIGGYIFHGITAFVAVWMFMKVL